MSAEPLSAELRRLLAEATPGPWVADERIGVVQVYAGEHRNCLAAPSEPVIYSIAGRWADGAWEIDPQHGHNARAIVAAVNVLPSLLERLAALEGALISTAKWVGGTEPPCWCETLPHQPDGHCSRLRAALKGATS